MRFQGANRMRALRSHTRRSVVTGLGLTAGLLGLGGVAFGDDAFTINEARIKDNGGGGEAPVARGDSYVTPRGDTLEVPATRLSGVLYNDFDPDGDALTALLVSHPANGGLTLNPDGSFSYTPSPGFTGDDQFTYRASDGTKLSEVATVNVRTVAKQTDFKIMMNYELGMHCTGFEFAYCCILPVYNSILAQIVKPEPQNGVLKTAEDLARLLEGDPNLGRNLDVLGRETVIRDPSLDESGHFNKYVVKYWHEAQSRNDGQGKPQVGDPALDAQLPGYLNSSTLISDVELHSLLAWNTRADAAAEDADNRLVLGQAEGGAAQLVVQGDGRFDTTGGTFGVNVDNFQNAIWNHLYVFEVGAEGVEGARLCVDDPAKTHCRNNEDCAGVGPATCGDTTEANKFRLGLDVDYPTNFGPGGHPMGPVSGGTFNDNAFLTFTGDTGTVVYTQMKLVENLPITLTSPRIWEALGLPLTPFEDTLGFFAEPGLVDESSIRPFVQMTAQLHEADCAANGTCEAGPAVLDSTGHPVQGFGTAHIDIPNCERCHAAFDSPNSPNVSGTLEAALVELEIDYWKAYYDIDTAAGDADWYARVKGAAISILAEHDIQHGTQFTANFPANGATSAGHPFNPVADLGGLNEPLAFAPALCLVNKEPDPSKPCSAHSDCGPGTDGVCDLPQNTRLGHESVRCHQCHADNVIAVVKSAECGPAAHDCPQGAVIPSLSEAIHHNHRSVSEGGTIAFSDALGRSGGCQGCHPAHRSDGVMENYPIDLVGNNAQSNSDNRLAAGGCYVGRDVHSNAMKDIDGAGTPEHLTALGQYLSDNVFRNQAGLAGSAVDTRGIWCTNCHTQAGQEIWKLENCSDLIHGTCEGANPRAAPSMGSLATTLGVSLAQLESWADPKDPAIDPDLPLSGAGSRVADETHSIWKPDPGLCEFLVNPVPAHDATLATVEVALSGQTCSAAHNDSVGPVDCSGVGGPVFRLCGNNDADGDFSVNILDFCTTPDCVTDAQATLANSTAVAVPFSAATDGREHWLAAGEPHCADCHAAPYVEQSGNKNAFPPFNYPRKASLMRYSRGHQDITCQGCHESTHGLYPVTPTIDNTSYAQAAALNPDGTHGPLKCGTCHQVDATGLPTLVCAPDEDQGKCDEGLGIRFNGAPIKDGDPTLDAAISWAHTFTDEANPMAPGGLCTNCHEDENDEVAIHEDEWLEHAMKGRVTRNLMDKVETLVHGDVFGATGADNGVCRGCHKAKHLARKGCSREWKQHLTEGRVAQKVWEAVSVAEIAGQPAANGTICGW